MDLPVNNDNFNVKKGLEEAQLTIAEKMSNYASYKEYIKQQKEEQEEYIPNITIPDTKLFLGFAGLNYEPNNVVAPDISLVAKEGGRLVPKSRVIVIIGRKGTGKSILSSIVGLDNFVNKFSIPTLAIDPAPTAEFYCHKESLLDAFPSSEMRSKLNDYEYKFNTKFRGYPLKVYKPSFDSSGFKEEGVDVDWALSLSDFKEMFKYSKLDAIQSLLASLEIQDNAPGSDILAQILTSKNFHTFGNVLDALKGKKFIIENEEEFKATGSSFRNRLNSAVLLNVFSRDYGTKDNIIEDLVNYSCVVLRGKPKTGEDSKILAKYYVYLQIALTKIIQERIKFVSGTRDEKMKSKLNHPYGIQIIIDEADVLCPNTGTSYLKSLIENIATKLRKAGITLILITQNLSLLDEVLTAQADMILTARLDNEGNIKALRKRGIAEESIDILRHLNIEKPNNYGFRVSEWAYIDQRNATSSFYPCLSLSAFKMQ